MVHRHVYRSPERTNWALDSLTFRVAARKRPGWKPKTKKKKKSERLMFPVSCQTIYIVRSLENHNLIKAK